MMHAERLLELARSQIGVKESPAGSNSVKYNTWYYGRKVSGSAYPWCMAFDQWLFDQIGHPLPYKTASCGALLRWYKKNDPACIVTIPAPGDITIFDLPGGKDTDHTGILESIVGDNVVTIDGNTGTTNDANGGAVMRRTRHIKYVKAFIRPRCLWEDDDTMTGEEIYTALQEYLATQEIPEWAMAEYKAAVEAGITDGTTPCALIPRYQAAIMALRAAKNGGKTNG